MEANAFPRPQAVVSVESGLRNLRNWGIFTPIAAQLAFSSFFFHPHRLALINSVCTGIAATQSWSYRQELVRKGNPEAAKQACMAAVIDVSNALTSAFPFLTAATGTWSLEPFSWVALPAAFALKAWSGRKILKARRLELKAEFDIASGSDIKSPGTSFSMSLEYLREYHAILMMERIKIDQRPRIFYSSKAGSRQIEILEELKMIEASIAKAKVTA